MTTPTSVSVIVGDLSGLQSFLFALSPGEGGHAKSLRARSFFIQTLAECCAMQFLDAARWPQESLVFCGAAKFVLSAKRDVDKASLVATSVKINEWLLQNLGGQLFFAWAMSSGNDSETFLWNNATAKLQAEKLRPWAEVARGAAGWDSTKLVLRKVLLDSHNRPVVPDESIFPQEQIGAQLPTSKWLEIGSEPKRSPEQAVFKVLDYYCKLHDTYPASRPGVLRLFTLADENAPAGQPRPETHHLARHIPTGPDGKPLTFEKIAQRAKGDKLLGVLKMDVDSLGMAFERLQRTGVGMRGVPDLSERLDLFFSKTLDEEKKNHPQWQFIYTVFSGGDDLLAVGPWNIVFEYADHVRTLFADNFGKDGLTISAGLAIVKPKFPIQRAAEHAEELLKLAKNLGKDRFAAFGQVWKWEDHACVDESATKLAEWVERKAIQRGWLEEVLRFAEAAAQSDSFRINVPGLSLEEIAARKRASLLATARLAYQTGRKYKSDFRRWVRTEIADLEDYKQPVVRNLPIILRYAITATRSK